MKIRVFRYFRPMIYVIHIVYVHQCESSGNFIASDNCIKWLSSRKRRQQTKIYLHTKSLIRFWFWIQYIHTSHKDGLTNGLKWCANRLTMVHCIIVIRTLLAELVIFKFRLSIEPRLYGLNLKFVVLKVQTNSIWSIWFMKLKTCWLLVGE